MRQRERKRLGEEREARAHRRRQIRAGASEGSADSDEVIPLIGGVFVWGKRRDKGGAAEGFIGGIDLERGLGFRAESDRRARSDAMRGEESVPSLEKILTGRAQTSVREGGEKCTGSETKWGWAMGRIGGWAEKVPRGLLLYFFVLFFLFSIFPICFIIFAK
jgi:hypothetical protein